MEKKPDALPCPNCGEMGFVIDYEDEKTIVYKCLVCNYKMNEEKKYDKTNIKEKIEERFGPDEWLEKKERNYQIFKDKQSGKSYFYLAKKYGLHPQRIYQIVKTVKRKLSEKPDYYFKNLRNKANSKIKPLRLF
jgi:transcription initiation factor TFIIIB Brf1 subunit/transcription initiation factor TFIIB